jgi:hypothetical protein
MDYVNNYYKKWIWNLNTHYEQEWFNKMVKYER